MIKLTKYILESFDKITPTVEWMKEKYAEFNKLFFGNELPKHIELDARNLGNDLGVQGEREECYTSSSHMVNGMYQMMVFPPGAPKTYVPSNKGKSTRWIPVLDNAIPIKSIEEVRPYIYLNSSMKFSLLELEDTLIHEMVHLWTFKDGLAPKRAHGKEFKHKCKEIKELASKKLGKKYKLLTSTDDTSEYEIDKDQLAKEIESSSIVAGGVWSIYVLFSAGVEQTNWKERERLMFCSKNMLPKILDAVKNASDAKYIEHIYLSSTAYVACCKSVGGKFSLVRKYAYWDANEYPQLKEMLKGNGIDVSKYDDSKKAMQMSMKINESLQDVNIVKISPKLNISKINLEDIVNGVDDEIEKSKKSKDNDKNIINHE